MTDFSMVRGADVKVTRIIDDKKRNVAEIVVNDQYTHRFSSASRVSKHLDVMEADDLAGRLTGGNFFFIGDQMIDFRDNQYNGFVHSDDNIGVFMDKLGFQKKKDIPRHRGQRDADSESDIVLRKVWDKSSITVPGYATGADFNSELSFVWNPFVKTINSSFDLVRLICSNGMVGLTSFLNTKVPLLNRWDEHLDIASRQIQNKVNGIIIERVQSMAAERASVADCLLLEQHAFDRLVSGVVKSPAERERLKNIVAAVAPKYHLHNTYKDNVFADKNIAAQLPAHLSNFDVFNIATELRSHTQEAGKSSNNALDKLANSLLFDREGNFVASASRYSTPKQASFSSVDRAFFGTMN